MIIFHIVYYSINASNVATDQRQSSLLAILILTSPLISFLKLNIECTFSNMIIFFHFAWQSLNAQVRINTNIATPFYRYSITPYAVQYFYTRAYSMLIKCFLKNFKRMAILQQLYPVETLLHVSRTLTEPRKVYS